MKWIVPSYFSLTFKFAQETRFEIENLKFGRRYHFNVKTRPKDICIKWFIRGLCANKIELQLMIKKIYRSRKFKNHVDGKTS